MPDVADLERALGYRFRARELLVKALTNPSFRQSRPELRHGIDDNQRLEFLGDAVLGLLSADQLHKAHPEEPEGLLTARRSRLVNGSALAALARQIHLENFILLGAGESPDNENALADTLESIFGAAWLDGGLEAARTLYAQLGIGREIPEAAAVLALNPKGELQQRCQACGGGNPVYKTLSAQGPDHAPIYEVRATALGQSATALGSTKKSAEAAAACALLKILGAQNER